MLHEHYRSSLTGCFQLHIENWKIISVFGCDPNIRASHIWPIRSNCITKNIWWARRIFLWLFNSIWLSIIEFLHLCKDTFHFGTILRFLGVNWKLFKKLTEGSQRIKWVNGCSFKMCVRKHNLIVLNTVNWWLILINKKFNSYYIFWIIRFEQINNI